jgi:hypothetical protein
VTDRRATNCDDEPRARDRISTLALGFRNLSERLDRRYKRVARLCITAAVISLLTLVGTILVERQRARDQATRVLDAATERICHGAVRGSCTRSSRKSPATTWSSTEYSCSRLRRSRPVAERSRAVPGARRRMTAWTAGELRAGVDDPTHYRCVYSKHLPGRAASDRRGIARAAAVC